jgi:hypothetical protein
MKKAVFLMLLAFSPLIAEDPIPTCDDESGYCPPEQESAPCCNGCQNRYWYFDLNYDYQDEREQQAYWPGKNESYLYDFLTK